jgi:PAS domain S-box-containing protein
MKHDVDFAALVQTAGDGVMVADARGMIIFWNSACQRIFGFTSDEAMGQSLDIIIPGRQQQRHWDGYHKTMQSGITRYGNDVLRVPAVNKEGHTLSIAFTVSLLHAADGAVSAIVAIVREETSRFNEERALRKKLMELEAQLAKQASPT